MWEPRHEERLTTPAPPRHLHTRTHGGTRPADPSVCGGALIATNLWSDVGYCAFVQLQKPRYLRYAQARLLDEPVGRAAVDTTFGIVASRWGNLLREPRPEAGAWRQLRFQISTARHDSCCRDPAVDQLYDSLPDLPADAVVLHCRLGMPVKAVADLMGVDSPLVAASLMAAMRRLPTAALERLEESIPHP